MSSSDDGRDGLQEGLEASEGDPRVLVAMNAVLSAAFAGMVLWGLDLLGVASFSLPALGILAICLFLLTHTITQ